jgi:hypothetical protein
LLIWNCYRSRFYFLRKIAWERDERRGIAHWAFEKSPVVISPAITSSQTQDWIRFTHMTHVLIVDDDLATCDVLATDWRDAPFSGTRLATTKAKVWRRSEEFTQQVVSRR